MLTVISAGLSDLYQLGAPLDITNYVVARSQIDAPLDRPEQLLLRQTDDAMEMTLVLDDAVLDSSRPWDLDRFCVVAEGVSHLLYVAAAASRDGQVSQLELELQAEIDKFALLLFMGMEGPDLLERLFSTLILRETVVCAVERARYAEAHRLGLRFCRHLLARLAARRSFAALVNELRKVYCMEGSRKLRYVNGCRP